MAVTALLVEDHEPTRKLVERLLASEGVRTDVVSNGREALAYLAQKIPDLVVSDIIMPFVDGVMLLTRVRLEPATAELPMLMLMADCDDEVTSRCKEAGAELLDKPLHRAELAEVLRRLVPQLRAA